MIRRNHTAVDSVITPLNHNELWPLGLKRIKQNALNTLKTKQP